MTNNFPTPSPCLSEVNFNPKESCYSPRPTSSLRARKLDLERRIKLQHICQNFPRVELTPEIFLTPELQLRWECACMNTSKYLNKLLIAQLTAELESVKFRLRGKENEASLNNAFESLRVRASTSAGGAKVCSNKASVEIPTSSQPTPAPRPLMSIKIPKFNRQRRQRGPTKPNKEAPETNGSNIFFQEPNPAIRCRDIRYFSSS